MGRKGRGQYGQVWSRRVGCGMVLAGRVKYGAVGYGGVGYGAKSRPGCECWAGILYRSTAGFGPSVGLVVMGMHAEVWNGVRSQRGVCVSCPHLRRPIPWPS